MELRRCDDKTCPQCAREDANRADERANVVAYLRSWAGTYHDVGEHVLMHAHADAIERGEHLAPTKPPHSCPTCDVDADYVHPGSGKLIKATPVVPMQAIERATEDRMRKALEEIARPVYDGRTCAHCDYDVANESPLCPGAVARAALRPETKGDGNG